MLKIRGGMDWASSAFLEQLEMQMALHMANNLKIKEHMVCLQFITRTFFISVFATHRKSKYLLRMVFFCWGSCSKY